MAMDQAPDQGLLRPIHTGSAALLQLFCRHPAVIQRQLVARGGWRRSAPHWLHTAGPAPRPDPMHSTSFNLGTVLIAVSGLFCLATLFFGTKGGYYDTDAYDGNGTAH
jgi:hypothetical protein